MACLLSVWAGCQAEDGHDHSAAPGEPLSLGEQAPASAPRESAIIPVGPASVRPPGAPADMQVESCVPPDFRVPIEMSWPALERDGLAEDVAPSAIELRLQNHRDHDLRAHLHFTVDIGASRAWSVDGPELRILAKGSTVHRFDLSALPLPIEAMRASGMVAVTASVVDAARGNRELSAASPPLFWHYGSKERLAGKAAGLVTVYDERTLEQTYHGGDLMGDAPPRPRGAGRDVIASRVLNGAVPIVTQGRTTPDDLVKMGLLDNYQAPRKEVQP